MVSHLKHRTQSPDAASDMSIRCTTDGVMGHFYRMGIRHYSPSLGRFLQRDPLSYLRAPHKSNPLSLNPYIYAINRPTDLSDTSGYQPCPGGCGSAMPYEQPGVILPEYSTDPSGGDNEFSDDSSDFGIPINDINTKEWLRRRKTCQLWYPKTCNPCAGCCIEDYYSPDLWDYCAVSYGECSVIVIGHDIVRDEIDYWSRDECIDWCCGQKLDAIKRKYWARINLLVKARGTHFRTFTRWPPRPHEDFKPWWSDEPVFPHGYSYDSNVGAKNYNCKALFCYCRFFSEIDACELRPFYNWTRERDIYIYYYEVSWRCLQRAWTNWWRCMYRIGHPPPRAYTSEPYGPPWPGIGYETR